MKSTDKFVLVLVASLSLLIAGCGGGGGSSDEPMTGDNGGVNTPATCPADQTGTPPNCIAEPTDEERAQARADAERIAGMIGPDVEDVDLADADTGTTGNQPIVFLSTDTTTGVTTPEFVRDTQGPPVNVFVKSSDMPAMISGLEGGIYTRTNTADDNTAAIHTVVKYKDMAANIAENYVAYFIGTAAGVNPESVGATPLADHGASTAISAYNVGVLTIAADVGANHELFKGDFGLTAGAGRQVITRTDDPDTANVNEAKYEVTGSFRGVPGTFSCSAASCTVESNPMGNLALLTNTASGTTNVWTFTPTVLADLGIDLTPTPATPRTSAETARIRQALANLDVPGVIQTDDFMIFGYWIQEDRLADGVTIDDQRMLPFADGKRNFGSVAAVTGSASYTGSATGLYMSKGLTSSKLPTDPFNSGQFTASVMLKAYFGATNSPSDVIPANKVDTVTGTISDFKDASGNAIDSRWTLSLEGRNDSHGTTGGTEGTFSGTAISADSAMAGANGIFSGRFYGAATTTQPLPISAGGTFDGHFTNGHVRGAFGVNKQ